MREEPYFLLEYELQWFAKDGEGGEKTEPATAKKLQDARENGQVAKSQELNHAVGLISLFLMLKMFIPFVGEHLLNGFPMIYNKIPDIINESIGGLSVFVIQRVINNVMLTILQILSPFFVIGFSLSVLINILQVKWKITTKPMKPKISKLNPLNGFKRIFSKDSLFELLNTYLFILLASRIAEIYC